jgi:O-acetyl-ADP-ribose deacetylase (regulator of RNase III)
MLEKEQDMEIKINNRTLSLVQGDITTQSVDAIVNAANNSLLGGGGVDGAIHRAGGPAILEECSRIGGCDTGDAVITTAGNMPAKHVIHTVGPVWRGGGEGEDGLLAGAYRRSLEVAAENGLETVAFPSISTGAYRFPLERAAGIALGTVIEFLRGASSVREVMFVLFNEKILDAYEEALSSS